MAMPRRTSPKKAASAKLDVGDRIIDAAMRLAAERSWHEISLAEIAAAAPMPVLDLYRRFRSKSAILEAFHRRIDQAVLAGGGAEEEERPRDRLFDILMRRFDALSPYKAAIDKMSRGALVDPLASLCGAASLQASMGWMLELGGVSAGGWRGRLRAKLLLGLYLAVLRTWLADDSADMTRTMAALDQQLRRAERWLGLTSPRTASGPVSGTAVAS
jgi:AcrR family transcriptional regulator